MAKKELLVCVRDTETKETIGTGMVIPVTDDNRISLKEATNFIGNFSASEIKEDNSLVVTAHLKNGESWSELYCENTAEPFTPDLAVDSFKMRLTQKVYKFLNSVLAMAK